MTCLRQRIGKKFKEQHPVCVIVFNQKSVRWASVFQRREFMLNRGNLKVSPLTGANGVLVSSPWRVEAIFPNIETATNTANHPAERFSNISLDGSGVKWSNGRGR